MSEQLNATSHDEPQVHDELHNMQSIINSLDNLLTPDGFEDMLHQAAKPFLTAKEIREQRISFAIGMLPHDSTITRKYIEDIVDGQRF